MTQSISGIKFSFAGYGKSTVSAEVLPKQKRSFPENDKNICIEFVSSKNKLKNFHVSCEGGAENKVNSVSTDALPKQEKPPVTGKQKYKQNKNDAITYCSEILEKNENLKKEWGWTMKMVKKDDYADCFLQGYWYMNELHKKS